VFPGNIALPGPEFPDDVDRSLPSFFGIDERTRLNHSIDGASYQLGDGQVARPSDSLHRLCLFFRKLDLRSDHDASSDYIYDYMITNEAKIVK
jgi:hypothetical protein